MDKPLRGSIGLRLTQRLEFPHKLGVCEQIFGSQLARRGIAWVDTAAGIPWKLDLGNATHRWIVYGKYEGAPFLNWARAYLPPDGIVVDSGANIGQMLLYLAQWVPNGRVLAIEPGRHQANWLEECLTRNPQLPVDLTRVAIGAKRGGAYLEDPAAEDRHGSWNRISDKSGERIDIVPLSEFLQERGIERVDLWKLDVEGYEIAALEGADRFLCDHRIRAVYSELDGDNGRAVVRHLAGRGYELHILNRRGEPQRVRAAASEHTYGLFLPVMTNSSSR